MLPRIGIVGCPDQVSLLTPILQSLTFPVTAVWCKNSDLCHSLGERYAIPFRASNFQELLLHPEVDLVYVTTEPGMHAEVAVKALTSGKHCICQKPPSISQPEAEKMVSLSRYYSQLTTLLQSHFRFLPAITRMKELVASGYCGQLLVIEARVLMGSLVENQSYSWQCDHSVGGGALNTVGSHVIDLVTYVSGQHAEKVHGCLKTFKPQTDKIHGYRTITSDDFCSFQMNCSDNLSATVAVNTHAPGRFTFEFSVTGTDGRLVVRELDLYGCKHSDKEKLFHQEKRVKVDVHSPLFPPDYYQPVVIGCRHMFQALKQFYTTSPSRGEASLSPAHGRRTHPPSLSTLKHVPPLPPSANFEDGIYIRTVLDAIFQSNSTGLWVQIPKVNLVESANPFWTTSSARVDTDKPSPKSHRPVFV